MPEFPNFDEGVADMLRAAHERPAGLPGFLGLRLAEIEAGRVVVTLEVRDELVTPMGTIHGGVMAGLVDHALGIVLYPLMKRGQWAATTEFKLNYLRPVRRGTLRAESTVLSIGRRSAVVRCEVMHDGTLSCAAQGTLLISDPPGTQ